MASIIKIKGSMNVFITLTSEEDIRELSEKEEAEILLEMEHHLNSLLPAKSGKYSLSLRVHLKEE